MSEIKALEKLRKLKDEVVDYRWGVEFDRAIDVLEDEIAERYMELPLDADGVPIRVGDYLQLGDTRGEVVALTCCPANGDLPWEWQCDTGDWYNTAFAHHVKPRTVEDVLREFTEKYQYCISDNGRSTTLAKYADEIRELLEVDA